MEKYYKTEKECKRLTEENKELEIKQKEQIEKKINNLKSILDSTTLNKELLSKENQELENKFKLLSDKVASLNQQKI